MLLLALITLATTGPAHASAVPVWVGGAAEAGATPVGDWPLDPTPAVVAGFAPPQSAWGSGHRGVDLLGRVGQPVRAALPGRVSFAGRLAGRGVVVVDHGSTRTTYEPVTATVAVGDTVTRGQRLGRLELIASHCFPRACLHWGWLRGTTYLDPLVLVGAGPVRLLPWRTGARASGTGATLHAAARAAGSEPPRHSPYAGWRSALATWRQQTALRPGGVLAGRRDATGPW